MLLLYTQNNALSTKRQTGHVLLEERVRFELTTLRICNPLHWATLPPFRITYRPLPAERVAGFFTCT